jgi:deazaflavin-dependent oxidoreductase (nitroreductase family)
MPLPKGVTRFNKAVANHVIRPLAYRLPGFAVIVHRGRVSGAEFRTPVNCWHDDQSAIVALTYGPDTDWLKNLTAAGGGVLVTGATSHQVGRPVLIGAEGMSRMPPVVRAMLAVIDVDQFAVMPLLRPGRPT